MKILGLFSHWKYLRKARETDRNYCDTAEGDVGPVARRLQNFPPLVKLVVGPFAECSEDVHHLLNTMAESKTSYQDQGSELQKVKKSPQKRAQEKKN